MDDVHNRLPRWTLLSFAIGVATVTVSLLTDWFNTATLEPTSPVSLFNVVSLAGLSGIAALNLDKDARTNRTIWETVNTNSLHAGLERIEVGAWVPPHSHTTEEIIVVCAGSGLVYDENGYSKPMKVGTMAHIAAHSRHAFRNVGDEPLLIVWLFPTKAASNKFEFRQRYNPP